MYETMELKHITIHVERVTKIPPWNESEKKTKDGHEKHVDCIYVSLYNILFWHACVCVVVDHVWVFICNFMSVQDMLGNTHISIMYFYIENDHLFCLLALFYLTKKRIGQQCGSTFFIGDVLFTVCTAFVWVSSSNIINSFGTRGLFVCFFVLMKYVKHYLGTF